MLDDVTIRPARLDDADALAAMYVHHWLEYLPDPADQLLAGQYNALIQLVRSPIALVAEHDSAVIGVCLGCCVNNGETPVVQQWVPSYEKTHARVLERAKTADADLKGELFCDEGELRLADAFIVTGSSFAQAQITLFMVEPWLKHQGIGTKLFERMRALMRSEGATRFFLMSDSASDYTYYEHRGMKLLHAYRENTDDASTWDRNSWAVLMYGGEL